MNTTLASPFAAASTFWAWRFICQLSGLPFQFFGVVARMPQDAATEGSPSPVVHVAVASAFAPRAMGTKN